MRRWSGRGVALTTFLHLLPTLRMSGAIPLLPRHALITKGTISPVHRTPSALLSHSRDQEILRLSWNLKLSYRSPRTPATISRTPATRPHSQSRECSSIASRFKAHFNIIIPSTRTFSKPFLPISFSSKTSIHSVIRKISKQTYLQQDASCKEEDLWWLILPYDSLWRIQITEWFKFTLLSGSSDTSCSDHITSAEGEMRMQICTHTRTRKAWKWKRDGFQYM